MSRPLGLWCRIFGGNDCVPSLARLAESLVEVGAQPRLEVHGEANSWFRIDITTEKGGPLVLERWLVREEGIRADLNSWAGFLETCDYSPHAVPLMERVIQSQQLFTLRRPIDYPDESLLERICVLICQQLAGETAGCYQIDDRGFYDVTGELLVEEY